MAAPNEETPSCSDIKHNDTNTTLNSVVENLKRMDMEPHDDPTLSTEPLSTDLPGTSSISSVPGGNSSDDFQNSSGQNGFDVFQTVNSISCQNGQEKVTGSKKRKMKPGGVGRVSGSTSKGTVITIQDSFDKENVQNPIDAAASYAQKSSQSTSDAVSRRAMIATKTQPEAEASSTQNLPHSVLGFDQMAPETLASSRQKPLRAAVTNPPNTMQQSANKENMSPEPPCSSKLKYSASPCVRCRNNEAMYFVPASKGGYICNRCYVWKKTHKEDRPAGLFKKPYYPRPNGRKPKNKRSNPVNNVANVPNYATNNVTDYFLPVTPLQHLVFQNVQTTHSDLKAATTKIFMKEFLSKLNEMNIPLNDKTNSLFNSMLSID